MNRPQLSLRAILLLIVSACLPLACKPEPTSLDIDASPIEMAGHVDAVFLGRVVSVDTRPQLFKWAKGNVSNMLTKKSYTLTSKEVLVIQMEVKEAFKGIAAGQATLIAGLLT